MILKPLQLNMRELENMQFVQSKQFCEHFGIQSANMRLFT